MSTITNQRIRLAIDTSQMGTINDVITGASPQFWNGVDLQMELAVFYGATLVDISNFDSITVELKASDPRTGLPLMNKVIPVGSLNTALSLTAWQGGAPTDSHAIAVFSNSETNLDLNSDTETFWLVISALTNDSPAHKIILGATPLNVIEGGEGVEPPAYVVTPLYYTAAQSDTRYTRSVDLSSINASLSTLNGEMAAVTTTANAAMPKSGGTFSGAITLSGLSGVLKTSSGLIAGGATTSDLPEGSNQYWTSARFTSALAAVKGAASGVCPLDSGSLIPSAYLPSITVHNTFVVSSQAAMLALAAHQGDVAIRTDLNESFILSNNTPTVLANWLQLLTPASAVTSVNSQTGAVTLTSANIAEGSNLYFTNARAQAQALTAPLIGFSGSTGGTVTASDSILVALGRLENRTALNDVKTTGATCVPLAGGTMTGDLKFSGTSHAGLVLNSLTDTQRAALGTPANGMMIYDSTLSAVMFYNGAWQQLGFGGSGGGGSTLLNGSGTPGSGLGSPGNYYLDIDNGDIYLNTSGMWAVIYAPPSSSLGGSYNTSIDGGDLVFNISSTERARLTTAGTFAVAGQLIAVSGLYVGNTASAVQIADSAGFIYTKMNTPASASASGTYGQICFDANYLYVCTNTDTWGRVALTTTF